MQIHQNQCPKAVKGRCISEKNRNIEVTEVGSYYRVKSISEESICTVSHRFGTLN